jgi:cyclopropane fatty-acyl-phospholipid synthase-like methyltransferase
MGDYSNHWSEYWSGASDPRWCGHLAGKALEEREEYYDTLARELRVLLNRSFPRVLDIGCGDGAISKRLFAAASCYVGVDLSPNMLAKFPRFGNVELVCADASSYCDGREFDLVFSNGVVQYFSEPQLKQYMVNVESMLAPEGVAVIASMPFKPMKRLYYSGHSWTADATMRGFVRATLSRIARGPDGIGKWYGRQDIEGYADSAGFCCQFFGSMLFTYRFHAVLKRKQSQKVSSVSTLGIRQ